ncbi:MAG: maleylacetate reductase [Betaproteobacteria bacterium]|nr:maleylacetate reductase [Betaproteobacteria bacterium]MDH5220299.1 maleylacetate reductase [Betaproteobacteria bacterium]MDH5351116.1 maleylacetate reductase [Betaproteobacteria bacterium]
MKPFTYTGLPTRVVFGAGSVSQLAAEVDALGARRALVLSTPGRAADARRLTAPLGARCAGLYDKAVMHVPVELAEDARRFARELGADCCVAIGGGSTIGLGKAIALTSGLPVLAVPTTYSGSEMTPIQGFTEGGLKRTQRDPRMLPKTVIYDPALTLGLPPATSAASGMNAMAHCVEALYAQDANPVISLMAEEGIRALAAALPIVVKDPADIEARSEALYGAWLAGIALGSAGMALHHKLCHTLGGTWNLPHAETHAIVLPHAARYNRDAAPEAMARVARALGAQDAPSGLYDLEMKLGLKMRLADIGMPADGLERAAELATQLPYPNPAPIEQAAVRALLQAAYAGRRPA